MLLPQNLSPDDCVYSNAAYVLEQLEQEGGGLTLADLFCKVRQRHRMSFSMLLLCLDWLYLIECIRIENEKIKLCS